MILIYTTHKNKTSAEKITKELLDKKLVACVNYLPIESSYWWKGEIVNDNEIVALYKTKDENWELVKNRITELHPYETPCIIKIEAEANSSYESWINKETKLS